MKSVLCPVYARLKNVERGEYYSGVKELKGGTGVFEREFEVGKFTK
jgi:hypothetical protein